MKLNSSKAKVVSQICRALTDGDRSRALVIAQQEYPFVPSIRAKRAFSPVASTRLFLRDGFIDRYFGTQLIFPGALRLLSLLLPNEFPAHPYWKMSDTHIAYWELFPTVDHLVPIARGGPDVESNWVTTSMKVNGVKSSWTLEELGWSLLPPGDPADWDGLLPWFLDYVSREPEHVADPYLRNWHRAAQLARKGFATPT